MDEDMEMRELKGMAFSHESGYSNSSSALGGLLTHLGPLAISLEVRESVANVQSKLGSSSTHFNSAARSQYRAKGWGDIVC